jgi:outer membrane protein assembly factor BamD (BamD/ComL family)
MYTMKKSSALHILVLFAIMPGCSIQKKSHNFTSPQPEKSREQTQALVKKFKKEQIPSLIKDMTLAQALKAREYYQAFGWDEQLTKLLVHIIALTKDVNKLAEYTLELADVHTRLGNLEQAQKLYETFVTFYPGSAHIKDVRYRQVVVAFLRSNDASRDQSMTRTTINYAHAYFLDFPEDDIWGEEIHKILHTSYRRLLESELGVMQFYVHRYSFAGNVAALDAAQSRLQYLRVHVLSKLILYDHALKKLLPKIDAILGAPSESEEDKQSAKKQKLSAEQQYAALAEIAEGLARILEATAEQPAVNLRHMF